MQVFLFGHRLTFWGEREHPFHAWEDLGEEEVRGVLGFEDFGTEGLRVATATLKEDDGVGVWRCGGDGVGWGWGGHSWMVCGDREEGVAFVEGMV